MQFGLRVPQRTREVANETADNLGISVNQYVEQLIAKDQQVRAGSSTSAGGSTAA